MGRTYLSQKIRPPALQDRQAVCDDADRAGHPRMQGFNGDLGTA